jgi:hypothetical protein
MHGPEEPVKRVGPAGSGLRLGYGPAGPLYSRGLGDGGSRRQGVGGCIYPPAAVTP